MLFGALTVVLRFITTDYCSRYCRPLLSGWMLCSAIAREEGAVLRGLFPRPKHYLYLERIEVYCTILDSELTLGSTRRNPREEMRSKIASSQPLRRVKLPLKDTRSDKQLKTNNYNTVVYLRSRRSARNKK